MLNQLSPRLSASYALTNRWSLNFNTGRYFELPPYTTLGYASSDGTLINKQNGINYIQSDHLVAGLEYRPNNDSKASIEGFYKNYRHYPYSLTDSVAISSKSADYGTFGDEAVIPIGQGRAYGMRSFLLTIAILLGSVGFALGQTTLFSENFESYPTTSKLPTVGTNQWIQYLIGANNNPWGIGGSAGSISGNNSLTIYHNNGTEYTYKNNRTERVAFFSSAIDAKQYFNLRLSFKWKCVGENNYDYGRVVWSTDGTNWNDVNTTNYQGQATVQTVTNLDISVADYQNFYIGFRWINDAFAGTNPGFTVDDIVLSGTPIPIYYSQSGDPTQLSSWNTSRTGGGTNPTSFTANNQTFVVQATHSMDRQW